MSCRAKRLAASALLCRAWLTNCFKRLGRAPWRNTPQGTTPLTPLIARSFSVPQVPVVSSPVIPLVALYHNCRHTRSSISNRHTSRWRHHRRLCNLVPHSLTDLPSCCLILSTQKYSSQFCTNFEPTNFSPPSFKCLFTCSIKIAYRWSFPLLKLNFNLFFFVT